MNKKKTLALWRNTLIILLLLLVGSACLSLMNGEFEIGWSEMLNAFQKGEGLEYSILTQLRIPRIVLAIAVGGGLSIAGVLLQGIYRNPLVEPYTMGVSGGAALGVALCIVSGVHELFGSYTITIFSSVGAYSSILLVYIISLSKEKRVQINKMLLIGVMLSFIASSAMMLLMSLSSSEELHNIIFWMMGSLNEPNTGLIIACLVISVLTLGVSYIYVQPLNAMRLGEVGAKQIGVNTSLMVKIVFMLSSIITGVCVSVTGIIGFVGLIIPHLARYFVGSDYRILLITSFISGGVFLILSDFLSRTIISPNELPIGVVTGIFGGVFFISALIKNKSIS